MSNCVTKSITITDENRATANNSDDMKYHRKKMSSIPETTDLNETVNESTPVFYGCLLLLVTLRFNAMINAIQQRTFSRLCCEVWSSQIVSQSWNIKFPSSTHHVLIAEAGEGTNARGKIQAICYSLCKTLTIFSFSIRLAIFCTPCQRLMHLHLLQLLQMQLKLV